MRVALLLCVVTFSALLPSQQNFERSVDWNLPDRVSAAFEKSKILATYDLSDKINPFYLRGDFDGDGIPDYAVLLQDKKTHHLSIAVVRSRATKVELLGAAIKIRNGVGRDSYTFDDFDWMDAWQVQRKQKLEIDGREGSDPHPGPMAGEGFLVEKSESASGIIYFDGKRYRWYQLGD